MFVKKKVKTNETGEENVFNHLFRTMAWWLIMARRLSLWLIICVQSKSKSCRVMEDVTHNSDVILRKCSLM